MAVDPRRTTANSTSSARPIPSKSPSVTGPAAQGYTDVAKSVLDRLRGVRRPSSLASPADNLTSKPVASHKYGPSTSQSTSHATIFRLRALDINQARTHVVLAGGKILKTVRVDDVPSCVEDFNIRTAAVNFPSDDGSEQDVQTRRKSQLDAGDPVALQRETFDIEDVAWSNREFKDHIATAARNGKIMLYNMKRPGIEIARLHEHLQQVHKVDFNPLEGGVLLSGSQDGTVRLWDLHSLQRSAMLCSSRDTYQGRSSGVRHVKWSPTSTWTFAFCTDTGIIQRWDTRNNKTPLLKIVAHDGHCNSIDWHPDGRHLISAGADGMVKVWDMAPDDKRQEAAFTLRAPHEIQNVRWRPPCNIVDSVESHGKQCTYFATSYRNYPVLHVWDWRRPLVPFREIHHNINSGTTDMLWRTRDLLWTVGSEGEFNQTDIHYAPKTVDRRPLSTFACSPAGDINFYTLKRPLRRGSKMNFKSHQEQQKIGNQVLPVPLDRVPSGRSSGDDSFTERFLNTSVRKKQSRTPSFKSSKSMSTTPPSIEDTTKTDTVDLRLTMHIYNPFNPSQIPKMGHLPGISSTSIFTYLAQKCKGPPIGTNVDLNYILNIRDVFEQNAVYAQRASLYRDAQTWRILGFQMEKELHLEAVINRASRFAQETSVAAEPSQIAHSKLPPEHTSHQAGQQGHELSKPFPMKVLESTSNMTTPIARPVNDRGDIHIPGEPAADVETEIHLPPSLLRTENSKPYSHVKSSEDSEPTRNIAEQKLLTKNDDQEEYLGQFRPQPRLQLAVDDAYLKSGDTHVPPKIERHISGESFTMFSTSTDSDPKLSRVESQASEMSHSTDLESSNAQSTEEDNGEWSYGDYIGPIETGVTIQNNAPVERRTLRRSNTGHRKKHSHLLSRTKLTTKNSSKYNGTVEKQNSSHPSSCPPSVARSPGATLINVDVLETRWLCPRPLLQEAPPVYDENTNFILPDFVPNSRLAAGQCHDGQMINIREMLRRTLSYYTEQHTPQMATQIFLLTASALVPTDQSFHLDVFEEPLDNASVLLYDHLTSPPMGFTPSEAWAIAHHRRTASTNLGLDANFIESFLSAYHEQLLRHQLLNAAATLRNWAYPLYSTVYDGAIAGYDIGLICMSCRSPMNNPNRMVCETCGVHLDACTFCWSRDAPPDLFNAGGARKKKGKEEELVAVDALWSCCPTCNHSMHAACASTWFADPHAHGACPVEGCFCDCLPGRYRGERVVAAAAAASAAQEGPRRGVAVGRGVVAVIEGKDGREGANKERKEGKRVRVVEPGE